MNYSHAYENESHAEFLNAVRAGVLSLDPDAANSCRHYMYMGRNTSAAAFKHIDTRAYVYAPVTR